MNQLARYEQSAYYINVGGIGADLHVTIDNHKAAYLQDAAALYFEISDHQECGQILCRCDDVAVSLYDQVAVDHQHALDLDIACQCQTAAAIAYSYRRIWAQRLPAQAAGAYGLCGIVRCQIGDSDSRPQKRQIPGGSVSSGYVPTQTVRKDVPINSVGVDQATVTVDVTVDCESAPEHCVVSRP